MRFIAVRLILSGFNLPLKSLVLKELFLQWWYTPHCMVCGVPSERPLFETYHKWLPVISDHDHYLAWWFYSFPLFLTSCKLLLGTMFAGHVCNMALRVYEEISVAVWNSRNLMTIVDVSRPILGRGPLFCQFSYKATTSRKQPLNLRILDGHLQEVWLYLQCLFYYF